MTTTPSPLPPESTLTAASPENIATLAATATAPLMPVDFSPILYGKKFDANTFFILLGGIQGSLWVTPDLAAVQFVHIPTPAYDVYTLAKGKFEVQGYAPEFSPTSKIYSVRTNGSLDEVGMVGVVQGWPVVQRDVQELAADNQLYGQIILDWLTAEGIAEPQLDILHIFRVDIEGDGAEEIFLSATHLDGSQHTTQAGDYSIVLMRKVVGNEALTRPIVGDIYHSAEAEITYPRTYSLANFIDLNKDGILEVIVDVQRWEKAGAIIFQIDGDDVIESLRVE
ncbi:MAG TPA: hypothetical protein VK897_22325 [Anaerolineales bacterium]|nr:hypothetical protein [Anaerolineales bacterium]